MARDNRDLIDVSEQAEVNWGLYIDEFEEKIFPHFKVRGYSKESALLLFQINNLATRVDAILDFLIDEEDEEITG